MKKEFLLEFLVKNLDKTADQHAGLPFLPETMDEWDIFFDFCLSANLLTRQEVNILSLIDSAKFDLKIASAFLGLSQEETLDFYLNTAVKADRILIAFCVWPYFALLSRSLSKSGAVKYH